MMLVVSTAETVAIASDLIAVVLETPVRLTVVSLEVPGRASARVEAFVNTVWTSVTLTVLAPVTEAVEPPFMYSLTSPVPYRTFVSPLVTVFVVLFPVYKVRSTVDTLPVAADERLPMTSAPVAILDTMAPAFAPAVPEAAVGSAPT